jgi:hypothetical protein
MRLAEEARAELVIVIFPKRRLVYFNRILNADPSPDHYDLAVTRELKIFANQEGIQIIDLYPSFAAFVNKLSPGATAMELPFFKLDGHMNKVGHRITAADVRSFFQRHCEPDINIQVPCNSSAYSARHP